jgi:glycosyltransferase involved in cell wall biosynthesis
MAPRVMGEDPAGERRLRVTLFVHDLAGNPVVRAAPLGAALARDHQVEFAGLLLSGDAVYAPYRGRLEARTLRSRGSAPAIALAARRLARPAVGDLVYAFKPLLSSLFPAFLAARRRGVPLLLDVDDDEWEASRVDQAEPGARGVLQRLRDTHALLARAVHPLTRAAAAVTVASRALQRRYGGTLVRHGPDEAEFDPGRGGLRDRGELRRALGLPAGRKLVVFAGRARPHKGWDALVEALARPEAAGWELVAAGVAGAPADHARARLGARLHLLGSVPNASMPALLAACDAAAAPQRDSPFARAQLPAKAVEAMAMALPVVATPVGDLPEILGGGARGWLVPVDDAPALAGALAAIGADPAAAARRGAAARRWFLEEASVAVARERLSAVVREALPARAPR